MVASSWITLACAVLTCLWSVPQLLLTGALAPTSHPLFIVFFLFPAQIGVAVGLLSALNAALMAIRRQLTTEPRRVLACGQVFAVVLLVVCGMYVARSAALGRELLLMALAFPLGQVPVALGLALHLRRRRRFRRNAEAAGPQ